jgi:hypothetical protein
MIKLNNFNRENMYSDKYKEFMSEGKCLKFIFNNNYGKKPKCPKCYKKDRFYLIKSRRRFDCVCGYSIYPMAGTIFQKSATPLQIWFNAIYLYLDSRGTLTAKQLERQVEVSYRCAGRILRKLRVLSFGHMSSFLT